MYLVLSALFPEVAILYILSTGIDMSANVFAILGLNIISYA
jgi:hypothetical protein